MWYGLSFVTSYEFIMCYPQYENIWVDLQSEGFNLLVKFTLLKVIEMFDFFSFRVQEREKQDIV